MVIIRLIRLDAYFELTVPCWIYVDLNTYSIIKTIGFYTTSITNISIFHFSPVFLIFFFALKFMHIKKPAIYRKMSNAWLRCGKCELMWCYVYLHRGVALQVSTAYLECCWVSVSWHAACRGESIGWESRNVTAFYADVWKHRFLCFVEDDVGNERKA